MDTDGGTNAAHQSEEFKPPIRLVYLSDCAESSTRPVLAMGPDGASRWVKGLWRDGHPNASRVARSLFTEQLVGRLGSLLGAPVCPVAIGLLPEELCVGEATHLRPGRVHLSAHVANARDSYLCDDSRVNRSAFIAFALLAGWLHGSDFQYLYASSGHRHPRVYSADHGQWLPSGWDWNCASLDAAADDVVRPHDSLVTDLHLAPDEFEIPLKRLEDLPQERVTRIVHRIPKEWGVEGHERLTLLRFLYRRRASMLHYFHRLNTGWSKP